MKGDRLPVLLLTPRVTTSASSNKKLRLKVHPRKPKNSEENAAKRSDHLSKSHCEWHYCADHQRKARGDEEWGHTPQGGTLAQEVRPREMLPVIAISPTEEVEEPRYVLREMRNSLQKEKVARIREQILQGTYQVSATDVAKAILRNGTAQLRRKKKDVTS